MSPGPFTFTITIAIENVAPVANNDAYTVLSGSSLVRAAANGVLSNDTDGDGDNLSAELVATVANGSLTLNGDGSFIYIPDSGYVGADSFTYRANDGIAESNIATVALTVTDPPPPPTEPTVTVEFSVGAPGSDFVFNLDAFPAGALVAFNLVLPDGSTRYVGRAVVDGDGTLAFALDTAGLNAEGIYRLVATIKGSGPASTASQSAEANFTIDASAPLLTSNLGAGALTFDGRARIYAAFIGR
jgi:hypothetical protein